jgi:hypothetical protein
MTSNYTPVSYFLQSHAQAGLYTGADIGSEDRGVIEGLGRKFPEGSRGRAPGRDFALRS